MKYILLHILLLCSLLSMAQSEKERKANWLYSNYSFDKAIKKYNRLDSISVDGLRNLAQSYHNREEFAKAEKAYAKFIATSYAGIEDYYNYALVLRANQKYEQVEACMQRMKEFNPEDLRVKNFFATDSLFAKLLLPNPRYTITHLKINSTAEDFGTSYFDEQIVFASTRKSPRPIIRNYNWNRKPFLDMFVAQVDTNYQLKRPKYWNKKYNKKWHEGPASFNKKGTFAAYTRNNYTDTIPDEVVRLQIFFSEFKKGEWQESEPFYLNNPAYSVGHPCLSRDGRTMYFVSDMPGGYGGPDIYVVKKLSKNKWSEPVNLGPSINTEGKEMFPFYHDKKGLLFYASNGLNGLGGLDVFVAQENEGEFDGVQNLGAPINTNYDDFAYIVDSKMQHGYFSSNRPEGKGGDDIYMFSFVEPKEKKQRYEPIVQQSALNLSYNLLILNETTQLPISKAEVKFGEQKMQTDETGYAKKKITCACQLDVSVEAFGYEEANKKIVITEDNRMAEVNDTIRLKVLQDKRIVLKNIYYDFDKSDILPESEQELDKLVKFLNENPTLIVELGSHTDCRGSDQYNIRLSQRRANSAVNYVISKGIPASRIIAKGYGETMHVNRCANGVECTEQEHRDNRRTEIYIPGFGKAEPIKQVKGKE